MFKLFFFLLTSTALMTITVQGQSVNDHIFPASAIAKSSIDFDNKGFIIEGKRTFLVSAGLEYARIPHELWRDRLLRISRAGFNCVEIYTIWNFHEPQEGKFNFSEDRDLDAFLQLVKELGLYAIVRVGPYYCAEWDNGGYPIWLKFKKNLSVREHNQEFEKYVDRFFDKLLPIVFKNQINKGGPVILVQLENEHPKGWGTATPDEYFKYLQSKALGMGMQVPYFFSGLHHDSDPAGNGKLDDASRPNPWFSTELWSVWYSQYGAKPTDAAVYDRRTWKIISRGGNGYNYYMAHGGSNFGYTNNNENAASYDYGAAIGQAGDLRPIYYTFKRAALFGRSFQNILENSTEDSVSYSKISADNHLKITARKSEAGDLIFLDNSDSKSINAHLAINDAQVIGTKEVTILPREIYPLIHNFRLNSSTTLDWSFNRVFAIVKQGKTTTIIIEAEKDAHLSLYFTTKTDSISVDNALLKIHNNHVSINEIVPTLKNQLKYTFQSGLEMIRVVVMSRQWTDKTFIVTINNETYIISGADYIGKMEMKGKQLVAEAECRLTSNKVGPVYLLANRETFLLKQDSMPRTVHPASITLKNWQYKSGANFTAVNYNASGWLSSNYPLPMGADGDISANASYRTLLDVPTTGEYTMQLNGNGRGHAFVDGRSVLKWNLSNNEITLSLKKGKHALAIFTAHDGRDKLAAYIGPIDKVDSKGIFGKPVIKNGGPFIKELHNWYFIKAENKKSVMQGPPKAGNSLFKPYKIGSDIFDAKEGFAWLTTTIPKQPAGTRSIKILFKSVDENATIFVNGKQIFYHKGWNQPFEIIIADLSTLSSVITLAVFIENYSNEGGIDQPVMMNTIGNATPIIGWKMKGGPGNPQDAKGWHSLVPLKANGPCFYRSSFSLNTNIEGSVWRLEPKGLGHGSIWLNGQNIGRYPEKTNISSLYLPGCWLKNGTNQLVIYDEDGRNPSQTVIVSEPTASRKTVKLSTYLQ